MVEEFKLYKIISVSNQHFKKGDILEVSNLGNVLCNGKPYKCAITQGYYYLCGKRLNRIVAELFLTDWDPNLEVDHIDGNRLNNRVDNLRMCSHKENMNNPITRKHRSKSCIGKIRYQRAVLQYTKDNILIKEYKSISAASKETGIYNIGNCCRKNQKFAGGYIWKYKN